MTRTRAFARLSLTLGLAAVLTLAACAPTVPASPGPMDTVPDAPAITPTPETATQPTVQADAPAAVATSRGPNLEATDPTTVVLASGGLQLVEFFRFT